MESVSRTECTLRIIGDNLIPSEVTNLLGGEPTASQTKGEELPTKHPTRKRIARFGMWRLKAERREPGDLEAQIDELLRDLTDDVAVWQELAARFRVEMFVGVFLNELNQGLSVSSQALKQLGTRGIKLDLDIYGG